MASMFSRLYAYRERPSVSPLENFLTEAFAEFFDRLPVDLKRSLIMQLLPPEARPVFNETFPNLQRLNVRTQAFASSSSGSSTRPDLVVSIDDRDVAVIEVKIGAELQQHAQKMAPDDDDRKVVRNQLETYATWIASENDKDDTWRGAVVFLTAYTEPPSDFIDGRADRVFRSTRRWKDVGNWILDRFPIGEQDVTHCAIGTELYRFLKERRLMTKYISERDIAAATLFVNSHAALHNTFLDILKSIGTYAPKLRGSCHYNFDFWSEANIYEGWFNFAQSIKRKSSQPYVAVGICFELSDVHASDAGKLPKHEPFFFLASADDWEAEKPVRFLNSLPEGWIEIQDEWVIAVAKPVRGFSSDPDERVEGLKAWARLEIDKLVACIPGYREAPTEAPPVVQESEEE